MPSNGVGQVRDERTAGLQVRLYLTLCLPVVAQLLEAGSDPRLKNNDGLKPVEVIPSEPQNEDIRRNLREWEALSGISKADVVGEYAA